MATDIKTIPLDAPIARDSGPLETIRLRRPMGGDYRGLSISGLGQLDYNEIRKLLPRISLDGLIAEEIDRIDGADMLEICNELTDFLSTTRRKEEFRTA